MIVSKQDIKEVEQKLREISLKMERIKQILKIEVNPYD